MLVKVIVKVTILYMHLWIETFTTELGVAFFKNVPWSFFKLWNEFEYTLILINLKYSRSMDINLRELER